MADAPAPLTPAVLSDLERLCPGGVLRDVALSDISRWRIGGRANVILRPADAGQLAGLRRYFFETGLPHLVIGATSNLLFSDDGLVVPCIQIGSQLSGIRITDDVVEVEAGAWVPGLARKIMQAGLTGAEHICGIPGTMGGLICMNGGSQRKGIGSALVEAVSVDREGHTVRRDQEACGFAYRTSIFQTNSDVILSARLRFTPGGDRQAIRREMLEILGNRRRKFPQKQPNCGSVFKSNPAMYAEVGPPGAVIERLGFKGQRIGDALVSPHHANFIVNDGRAQARDVLQLIARIRNKVIEETGYTMDAEALFVTSAGEVIPTDHVPPQLASSQGV